MNKQSAFINEESHEKIVKENEEEKHKELKRKRNCERQRAYYQRQKDLKKNEEKKKKRKVPKTNAERQREFRQRNAEKKEEKEKETRIIFEQTILNATYLLRLKERQMLADNAVRV